jgi:hypothetical protein
VILTRNKYYKITRLSSVIDWYVIFSGLLERPARGALWHQYWTKQQE